jgi:hypothetical protein
VALIASCSTKMASRNWIDGLMYCSMPMVVSRSRYTAKANSSSGTAVAGPVMISSVR